MATNIEKSELVIATILAHLLDQGLQRSMLGFKSLGLSDEYANFYPVCFRWLVSEGLVSAYALSDIMDGNLQVTNPVLTAHGLAVMGRKINGADGEVRIDDAIRATTKSGGSLSQFGDFVGGILGGFTKSIGS